MKTVKALIFVAALLSIPVHAQSDDPEPLDISAFRVNGVIDGENITFGLAFNAVVNEAPQEIALAQGNLVFIDEGLQLPEGSKLRFDPAGSAYYLLWSRRASHQVDVRFAVWPEKVENGEWREATLETPTSRVRELEVVCDRTDLEVVFPGALKQTRTIGEDGVLTITALLGPGKPFKVRWKPMVAEMEGKLVLSSDANTIATVRAGTLRLDTLYQFQVAQGKLREINFRVPDRLNVTQVRCPYIRDWQLTGNDGGQQLQVILNRAVTESQPVQIVAETVLGKFPLEIALPIVQPLDVIRASGHVSVGTNSAIQLLVQNTAGLSQIDGQGFPTIVLNEDHPRLLPRAKTFYYSYATTPYQVTLSLADIVPAYDASSRLVFHVKEDNLTLNADIELDIRDAGIRNLQLLVDEAMVVSGVTGPEVEDFSVREEVDDQGTRIVDIQFAQPVIGRSLIKFEAETGGAPIGAAQVLKGVFVKGAESQRGYVVLVAEKGVQLGQPTATDLRKVHTASIPMTVPNAQYAYRFRSPGWQIELVPSVKPASVLAESFHLLSVAEGITYGSTLVTYFISGAPLDEFRFRIPDTYRNVEFVGRDVRRWEREGDVWVVRLQRKAIGDFNLGITYSQRPGDDKVITAGGATCADVETESGYIAVTSGRNVELSAKAEESVMLLEIKQDEIPANYRLLAKLPILKSYKYVGAPHSVDLEIVPYEQGSVLPALIEVMQVETDINVNNDGQTQAVTKIRYKVKNSSKQYLNLSMPLETAYWTVRQEDMAMQGRRQLRNVVAQRDEKTGMLMIPLARKRNPNDPITIELEYGQVFGKLGWFGEVDLEAPRSLVKSTYSQWLVRVPESLALLPGHGSTMPAQRREGAGQGALGNLLSDLVNGTEMTLEQLRQKPQVAAIYWVAVVVILVVAGLFRPRTVVPGLVTAVFAFVAFIGLGALNQVHGQPGVGVGDLRQVIFNQALDLQSSSATQVSVQVTPAWLGGIAPGLIVGWGCAVVAGLIIASLAKGILRQLGLAVALLGIISLGVQFPAGGTAVAHTIAWGLPGLGALVGAIAFVRVLCIRTWRYSPRAVAAAMIALTLCLGSAAHGMASTTTYSGYETITRSVDVRLFAEKDHMRVEIDLALETLSPITIPLVDTSAVMMVPEKLAQDVEIVNRDGMYVLRVGAAGKHFFSIKFLTPLPTVEESQRRAFKMPLPMALTNRVSLTVPRTGMDVVAGGAIQFVKEERAESTVATAVFAPGKELIFAWQPRSRETKLETTSYFVDVNALFRFDAGLADGRHRIHFQIAQGELRDVLLTVPEGMTVTAVSGQGIGAWRFDPATREVEVKLAEPATGDYVLIVSTQMASDKFPCTFKVGLVGLPDAVHQRGTIGIVTTPAVYANLTLHPPKLNLDDYLRDAALLLKTVPGLDSKHVRHAFRVTDPDNTVELVINEVHPEVRSAESAGFTVADDRLVYSGNFTIGITKAGMFSADLKLSPDYDIDSLSAPQVSHWDEIVEDGTRVIRVHFRSKLMGDCGLSFALSKPVADLPPEIELPHIEVVGALKHSGQVTVSADRGIRLTVKPGDREGISELDPNQIGIRNEGALVFKLLKPDWRLVLRAEVVEPRVNVEFLHVARVSEGMVRHKHHLRYRLHNAGSKIFELAVPSQAMGLQINGPNIARLEEIEQGSGIWRIELAAKVLERPFPLTISYETKFDQAAGAVGLVPVKPRDVDLQRGYIVVFGSDRVELHPDETTSSSMQSADPRTVPAKFGQDDLAGAAFCFTSAGGDYSVGFKAVRHRAAELLTAEVSSSSLTTVVTDHGEMISQVDVQMRSGDRRHLEVTLPFNADMWSLVVNGRATVPSKRTGEDGREVILVPLGQVASTEMTVTVQFIYVASPQSEWQFAEQLYEGPRFDLPLKNISWTFYVPDHWQVSDFGGTLNADERTITSAIFESYDLGSYEQEVRKKVELDLRNARDLQDKGFQLAREGNAYEAKQALEWAYNYSYADPALNEDARVQLNKLMQEQAVAGLVQRRGAFRQKAQPNASPGEPTANTAADLAAVQAEQQHGLDAQTVTRLQSSLSKADSENLENITNRIIEVQEAAAGAGIQLLINMPLRGRVLNFTRPLQVKPNAPMLVSFDVRAKRMLALSGWLWTLVFGGVLFTAIWIGRGALAAVAKARAGAEQAVPAVEDVPEDFVFEETPFENVDEESPPLPGEQGTEAEVVEEGTVSEDGGESAVSTEEDNGAEEAQDVQEAKKGVIESIDEDSPDSTPEQQNDKQ